MMRKFLKGKVKLLGFLLTLLIITTLSSSAICSRSKEDVKPVLVKVDFSKDLGEIPNLMNPGIMTGLYAFIQNTIANKEIDSLDKKIIWRLHFSLTSLPYSYKKEPPTEKEWEEIYEYISNVLDKRLRWFEENGHQVILSIAHMPLWLSENPDNVEPLTGEAPWEKRNICSPPRDYEMWKEFIKRVVSRQREDGLKLDYIIWDEPDWMFYGSEEEYFLTYKYAAEAIKEVDPEIRVGALGVSNFNARKHCFPDCSQPSPYDHTMLEGFIDFIAENPQTPVDFIDWHFESPETVREHVTYLRRLIREKLPREKQDIFLTIGEGVYSSHEDLESTELASSYLIFQIYKYAQAGIYRYTATSFTDQAGWTSGNWQHVGFFSDRANCICECAGVLSHLEECERSNCKGGHEYVIKPKWNAFKVLSRLRGRRISATSSDEDHVVAIASRDKGKVSIIIANYVHPLNRIGVLKLIRARFLSEGFSREEWDLIRDSIRRTAERYPPQADPDKDGYPKINESYLRWVFINTEFTPTLDKENVREVLLDCIPQVMERIEYEKHLAQVPREVDLIIRNLPKGRYILRTYVIDREHSNSCRLNKRTEPEPTDTECGIGGLIDQEVERAKEEAEKLAEELTEEFLLSRGYSQRDLDLLQDGWQYCKDYWNRFEHFEKFLRKIYKELDRYRDYPNCSVETIWDELREAFSLYRDSYLNLFYYGKYTLKNGKTVRTSEYIDKINNLDGVSLESSEKVGYFHNSTGNFEKSFTMQPYSVVLIEIEKL